MADEPQQQTTQPLEGKPEKAATAATYDIYTMPKDFYVEQKKEGSGKGLRIALAVVGVLIVFGGAAAYVFLTQFNQAPEQQAVLPPVSGGEALAPDITDTVSPVEEATTVIEQPPQEPMGGVSQEPPEETIMEEQVEALPFSIDLDSDGLTDIEETLLGTDPATTDSDSDGFTDGAEVAAGFDPAAPSTKLSDSNIFKAYTNVSPAFDVVVPSGWTEERNPGEQSTVRFIALNGDAIVFTVRSNNDDASIDSWYAATFPERTRTALTSRVVASLPSREDMARREVYIPLDGAVLMVHYDVSGKKEIAYPAVWNYIVDTISL